MENENTRMQSGEAAAEKSPELSREDIIVRTSFVGIITNVFLAIFKAAVGLLSNSIAVILDAVNNLSDALSSIITIVGTMLSSKAPDREHPLGHGRVEYLSSLIVSAIVLYAGLTSLVESVKKIIHPEKADYSFVSLLIISVAIAVKLLLGAYVTKQGKKVNSGALVASGSDASFDAILSASVLASAIIYTVSGISLEAYVGTLIAVVIIRAGYEMMTETLDDILGRRADPEVSREVKRILMEEPEIMGAYDLLLNNYGPGRDYASVHVELRDNMTVAEVDSLTRRVEAKVYRETGVILTGIGVYSHYTSDDEVSNIRNDVQKIVLSHSWALQFHGFYIDTKSREMRFDVVISFDKDAEEGLEIIRKEVQARYPDYSLEITPDLDISD